MKRISLTLSILATVALISCQDGKKKKDKMKEKAKTEKTQSSKMKANKPEGASSMMENNQEEAMQGNISLTQWKGSKQFPNAGLKLKAPTSEMLSAGKTHFKFEVKNYELGAQTKMKGNKMLANSKKGQHIHFILDNGPYKAHYKNSFTAKMNEGVHVVLAFLSRSYHESVKNGQAFVVKKFKIGNPKKDRLMNMDLSSDPILFYSRPKGTYTGEATKNVLLDFFLLNTKISPNGNNVRATINGKEFMIDEWAPYIISGLPMGKNTIKLELVDKNGNVIEGPFNTVKRVITLKK